MRMIRQVDSFSLSSPHERQFFFFIDVNFVLIEDINMKVHISSVVMLINLKWTRTKLFMFKEESTFGVWTRANNLDSLSCYHSDEEVFHFMQQTTELFPSQIFLSHAIIAQEWKVTQKILLIVHFQSIHEFQAQGHNERENFWTTTNLGDRRKNTKKNYKKILRKSNLVEFDDVRRRNCILMFTMWIVWTEMWHDICDYLSPIFVSSHDLSPSISFGLRKCGENYVKFKLIWIFHQKYVAIADLCFCSGFWFKVEIFPFFFLQAFLVNKIENIFIVAMILHKLPTKTKTRFLTGRKDLIFLSRFTRRCCWVEILTKSSHISIWRTRTRPAFHFTSSQSSKKKIHTKYFSRPLEDIYKHFSLR